MPHAPTLLAAQHLTLLRAWTQPDAPGRVHALARQLLRRIVRDARRLPPGAGETRLSGELQVSRLTHTQALAAWDVVRDILRRDHGLRRTDLRITQGDRRSQLRLAYGVEALPATDNRRDDSSITPTACSGSPSASFVLPASPAPFIP